MVGLTLVRGSCDLAPDSTDYVGQLVNLCFSVLGNIHFPAFPRISRGVKFLVSFQRLVGAVQSVDASFAVLTSSLGAPLPHIGLGVTPPTVECTTVKPCDDVPADASRIRRRALNGRPN